MPNLKNEYQEFFKFHGNRKSEFSLVFFCRIIEVENMKICLITICRNEETLVPYFLDHYAGWVDEIVVFDNESEDDTVKLLKACPKVRVMTFSTSKYYKEEVLTSLRNDAYRLMGLVADWFIIVDIDEFLFHENMREYLNTCDLQGVTVPKVTAFEMYAKECPVFDGRTHLHERVKRGIANSAYDKHAIVHHSVLRMNYGYGSHDARPVGNVKISNFADITLLHFKPSNIGLPKVLPSDYFGGKAFGYIFTGRLEVNFRVTKSEECLEYALPVCGEEFLLFVKQVLDDLEAATAYELHQLSLAYHRGHHVKQSNKTAFDLAMLAGKKGNADAQYHVGMGLKLGVGTALNREEALAWLKLSAIGGRIDAAFQVGMMTMPQAEAYSWMLKAAEGKHAEACSMMAQIFRQGLCGHGMDNKLYMMWLQRASENGCKRSSYTLAQCYLVSGDAQNAYRWAKKSARHSFLKAYQMMEESYRYYNPFDAGSQEAEEWFLDRVAWLQNSADTPNFDYYDEACPFKKPVFER